jgi:hypothetical protein
VFAPSRGRKFVVEIIGATTVGREEVRCRYRRGGAMVAISLFLEK